MDTDGEPIRECAWMVPRHRLTEIALKTMCLTCPEHIKIGYLKDKSTGDIVWPPDAQLNCHPLPWSYAVIAVEEREARPSPDDPFYSGDLQLMIVGVPLTARDDATKVTSEDVKAWLLCGLLEEDEDVKEARDIVRTLEAEAKVVEHNLSRVGYMKFTEKTGFGKEETQMLTDEEQAAKREERHEALSAQRDKMEENVADARDMLEGVLKQRNNTPVNLEQANVRTEIGTCTFYVSFPGFYGPTLEDIVCAKTDWPGLKLAAGHDDLPPWAGRGEIPDGSKSYIKRYNEHAINMRGAQICRLQHGFGQHKASRASKAKKAASTPGNDDVIEVPPAADPGPPPPKVSASRCSDREGTPSAPPTPADALLALRPRGITSSNPGSPSLLAVRSATGQGDGGEKKRKSRQGEEGTQADVPPFAGKGFYFYHGEYVEGLKSGFGIEFTDADVYYGEYVKDKIKGVGALQCANGDLIEGSFVSETRQV
ncbi:unnamed protein product [Pylaiella littoralis]